MLGWPAGRRTTGSWSPRSRTLPDELVAQLGEEAVMVIPVAGEMLRVTTPGPSATTRHGGYRFVPLR